MGGEGGVSTKRRVRVGVKWTMGWDDGRNKLGKSHGSGGGRRKGCDGWRVWELGLCISSPGCGDDEEAHNCVYIGAPRNGQRWAR